MLAELVALALVVLVSANAAVLSVTRQPIKRALALTIVLFFI
jgi:hypothetical protein